jgi:hypothetical protein
MKDGLFSNLEIMVQIIEISAGKNSSARKLAMN